MNRTGTIILLILVVALGAVTAFALFGGSEPPVLIDPGSPGRGATTADETSAPVLDAGTGTAAAPVDASTRRIVEAEQAAPELDPDIEMALAGFEGRVVDHGGAAVADTLVQLFRFAPDAVFNPEIGILLDEKTSEPDIDAGEQRTGDDGRFRITGVWPRAFYLLKAGVDSDAPTLHIVQKTPGPGQIVDLGDIVLEDAGILTGVVVDEDGEPVPGALVRAVDLPGSVLAMFPFERFDPEGALIVRENLDLVLTAPAWVKRRFDQLPIATTRSGLDGAFRLCGVVPGSNLVAVTAQNHLSNVKPRVLVKAGQEKDLGRLRLPDGETVIGRVVDEAGKPVAGAEVVVASESPAGPVHMASFAEPTDTDGGFRIGGFPSRNVVAAARRGPGSPWVIGEPTPAAQTVVIRLASTHKLTLTLQSRAGLEIEAPRFQLTPGHRDEGGIEMAMWGVTRPVDLDGRLGRLEDGRFRIDDLAKGSYVLVVQSAGHAATALGIELLADVDKTIELGPKLEFEVLCVDARGAPVRSATVYAEASGDRPRLPDMPLRVGTTGADGKLLVDDVSATAVQLTAQHPAYGTAHGETPLPPPAGPILLTFLDPGAIEGVLTDGREPPAPGKWTLAISRNGDGQRGAMPDMPRLATPDLEGNFAAAGLKPGTYSVSVIKSLDLLRSPGKALEAASMAFMTPDTPEQDVEVQSGQVARVALDATDVQEETGPSARITGSVAIDGRTGAGLVMTGWGDGKRHVAEVDQSGRFDLGQVKVGHVWLQLMEKPDGGLFMRRQSSLWQRSIQIEEGKDQDLTIDISTSSLEGFVTTAGGTPARGANIWLNGEVKEADGTTTNVHFSAETDDQGAFQFEKVPAGTYSAEAHHQDGRASRGGIEVHASIPQTGVTLVLRRVYKIRGTVDLSALGSEPPEWMWLKVEQVSAADGQHHQAWASIDHENGRFEADDVVPGTYQFELLQSGEDRGFDLVDPTPITVGEKDVEGVVIRPVKRERKPPPEPQPETKK